MIKLKNEENIRFMARSGEVVGAILHDLKDMIAPGVTTLDIDRFVEEIITANGMTPTFKGYNGFPASACVSVNDELVHGIPKADRALVEGDIVSVDIGATYDGWVSDSARTYAVGNISPEAERLIDYCRGSFFKALEVCREGHHLTDIGHAVQTHTEAGGYSVVRDYTGHGVGRDMHESPQILNYGEPGRGPLLTRGMALAIEPMINQGGAGVHTLADNWTVVTDDGKLAAHYENTIIITDGDPLVITLDERDR
jgi:methionyl aminopeptidase